MKNKRIISITLSLLFLFALICPSYATELKPGDSVIIGGMPFGVKFFSGNLTVSGFSNVDGEKENSSPAFEAGMRENDIIVKLNNKNVKTAEEFTRAVEESNGKEITLLCTRNNEDITFKITPVKSITTETYKIGIWIKDSTAGIGTITYINPTTGEFGGLGHGICSSETGKLLAIRRGIVSDAKISGINKGEAGCPGELKGFFVSGKIGIVTKNSNEGVFGVLTEKKANQKYPSLIKIGSKEEMKSGKATILCTLSSNKIKEYDIDIQIDQSNNNLKSFLITVTDNDLITETGGIVQGMSGSPIIQNGKLVGAVTHVLVNDPTRGYGIFIENMLEAANSVEENKKMEKAS